MRPLPAFALFLAAYLAVIATGWLGQTPTSGELAGHAAKIAAILDLLRGGDFAWFPDYLTGSPAATLLSFALSVPVYAPGLLLSADPIAGMKVTALALLALAGLAAFAFGRRLACDGWTGFAVGCAYLLAPQILLRTGWQEHMTIVVAIPLVPLAFLAMLRVAERGSPFDALLLATTISATLLAWSKMGATLAIPLGLFALWLFVGRPECRANLARGAAWAVPATLLLGVLPLLPLLRERGFMTVFELDPFAQWQAAYSVKTATAWLDRAGDLFAILPRSFSLDRGGYYLGFVGLAAVIAVVALTWRADRRPRELAPLRVFLLLALAMFWVSFGPRNVLQGHFEFLGVAQTFPDWGIPLHWLALAAQGVLLHWCLPARRWRTPAFLAIFAVYLVVPAFRVLERLPLYADLRAPDSFWILNGTFAWAVASALAVVFLLRRLPRPRLVPWAGLAALLLAGADFSAYFRPFFSGGLDAGVLKNFRHTADHLRENSGRVLVLSGRYFYLDLPRLTDRPLANEALNRYLTPATTARLQTASRLSATDMIAYLRLSGIGDVVIERRDPDIPSGTQKWFRTILPLRAESPGFLVLTNPLSLHPAFFGASVVPAAAGYEEYVDALRLAKTDHLTIARPDGQPLDEDLPGLKSDAAASAAPAPPLEKLPPATPRTASRVQLDAPGRAGWVVLSESWHPDWTALVDGVPVAVYRTAGGFPAVPVTAAQRRVEFQFTPPAWYAASLLSAAGAWTLALLGLVATPLLPRRFHAAREFVAPSPYAPAERPPVTRPVALVPTYNESASITALLDRLLAVDERLAVLVIDDASPDGTADLVRGNAAFGARIHLLERSGKLGLGSAYRAGFAWAAAHGHDVCLEIDADFSHDPADIPRLLAALDAGADAAIGSRYLDGVRVINWPEHRLALSVGASRYVRLLTGLPLTDATSGFKALRTAALRVVDPREFRADGYGFQIELHWLLWTAGCRLVEIPIVFTERRAGQTKMTPGIAVEAAARVLQLGVLGLFRSSPRPPAAS